MSNGNNPAEDRNQAAEMAAVRRARRAANAPVDGRTSSSGERLSQARARDREALRTYRALAEKPDRSSQIPTRRQLRLQQQGAPATQLAAVVPMPDGEGAGYPAERPLSPVREGGRRDRRRRTSDAGPPDGAPVNAAPVDSGAGSAVAAQPVDNSDVEQMSVEQALAAREAIIGQAQNQVAMMEAAREKDPFSVDLLILAKQKALAERAAVLNTRAEKIQKLSQENAQRRPQVNDPTTAHNLSIVSPLEFVQVPGTVGTSPNGPSTSHIPLVAPAQRPRNTQPSAAPGTHTPVPAAPAAPPSRPPAGFAGRSQTLAQAEALVSQQRHPGSDGTTPVHARSAHGLDPLDAMTAGLARARRMQFLQYVVVALGALAFVTGIMMITDVF